MKKVTLLTALSLALLANLGLATLAQAEEANTAKTENNHVIFEVNTDKKPIIDPVDPSNPNPPSPIDPTDKDNNGTGNTGALTIDYAPNIDFGTKKLASGDQKYTAKNENPFVQVTDLRGTGAGWKLTANISKFANADGSKELKGAVLSFKNGEVKTRPNNVSGAPVASDVSFDTQETYSILIAEKDNGKGSWVDVFSGEKDDNSNVELLVLEGSADVGVNYTATINWSLVDTPTP